MTAAWAREMEERLGYRFNRPLLLEKALTHRSYANEDLNGAMDNERLEFLGDAVLDFIVGEWAYHRYPEMPEGILTKIRAYLVNNERLADFARKIDLGGALRLGRGERSTGGAVRGSVLGSAFEALIGAIYLDSNLDKVRRFVIPLLDEKKETALEEIDDPKSRLQEITQARKLGAPRYRVVSSSGPDHARIYEMEVEIAGEVMGRGSGTSKANAERE
ncbi:MAG: ribonuclease III, partial [Acidobacteria bacterium]|nr:ribonuclease III [Acidobacteriota bacterium]